MTNIFQIYFRQHFHDRLDFTYTKYEELCKALALSDRTSLTVRDYVSTEKKPDNFVIIRHDIDDESDLYYASKMAMTENEMGIKATYYFRICKNVFDVNLIKKISELGHEIGYHYEVLGEAEGDYERAIQLFENHLKKFRAICEVNTIAQHGGPLRNCLNVVKISNMIKVFGSTLRGEHVFDRWESKDIWKRYDYKKYGIIGEPYLSIDFNEVTYLSDTNRSWVDTKYRIKDKVDSKLRTNNIETTDDIIDSIKNEKNQKVHFLIHPSNWKMSIREWVLWLLLQQIRNIGKRTLVILKTKR